MRKLLWSAVISSFIFGSAVGLYMYKIRHGFPVGFETDQPSLGFRDDQPAILLFSKTTGYRHSESILASKKAFRQLAQRNGWLIYETEKGGVFNIAQLSKFNIIVMNNCTGRVLNATQKQAVEQFVQSGGTLLGIHSTGDFSHSDWPWLQTNLIGALFSHHTLHPQLQRARVYFNQNVVSWTNTDEWYIYYSPPSGMTVVAYIDGEKIQPNGNLLFMGNKNFGMGKYHPVAWYRHVGKGKTFYTSMGHHESVWRNGHFLNFMESTVKFSLEKSPR